MDRLLYRHRSGLRIPVSDELSPDFLDLIRATRWGREGGVVYKVLDLASQLCNFRRVEFVSLRERDRLIGATMTQHKSALLCGEAVPAIYMALLSISPERRGLLLGSFTRSGISWHAIRTR